MADENLDEDLQSLLDQLDDQEEFMADVEGPDESEDSEIQETEDEQTPEAPPLVENNGDTHAIRPIEDLQPTDVRRLDLDAPQTAGESIESQIDVNRYLEQLDGVTTEVLQACRSDRQEAQDVINMLRTRIDQAINNNQNPQRMYVDGLVKAVEVKAGINATAVKMMEGVSKMLASVKAGINIQNNNLQVSGSELDDILSQDVSDDLD